MLKNLWNDADARGLTGVDELMYRAHILGQDPSVTNWKGGNISLKQTEAGFDGEPLRVLRVKGSGSDLKTAQRDDFVGVALDPVLRIQSRASMSDEEMVAYLAHCLTDIPSKRPSIETLMHSFLPFAHVDHTHADYILWFACASDGRKVAEDLFGDALVWIPYQRRASRWRRRSRRRSRGIPGPPAWCWRSTASSWGETSKECYFSTIELPEGRAMRDRAPRPGARRPEGGGAHEPRGSLNECCRRCAAPSRRTVRWSCTWTTRPRARVRERARQPRAGRRGRGLPRPPGEHQGGAVLQRLDGWQRRGAARRPGAGAAAYARSYAEYFERFRDPKDAMDDPYPRVILVPGIGMVTTGKNKDTAIAASWLYHRAITVMKGVASMGRFVSLDERESFGIEYWPLERYKLTQMPPEKEMTGRVALVTGGASIGRAAAEGWLAWALTSCSRTSTRTARGRRRRRSATTRSPCAWT